MGRIELILRLLNTNVHGVQRSVYES
jgi:hypothetical protein